MKSSYRGDLEEYIDFADDVQDEDEELDNIACDLEE